MSFTAIDAFGVVGLVLLLGAFVANALGRLSSASRAYQFGNFAGSGILAVYSYAIRAWVFFPLEVVWAAVALVTLFRRRAAVTA
ncbi:MAG: CBU_0592 family membrane protein [Thermoplasmatota archaeon]